jgi:Chalcone isomerase-like
MRAARRQVINHVITAVMFMASGASLAQTVELEGVKLEPTVKVGAATLQLNGAGVRTRVVFKVYVAGLYVPHKSSNAATLLADKGARRVAITMLRGVDADTFVKALNDGLHNNHTDAQLAAMKPQIDALNAILISAGEVKKGDVIHFDYLPDAGTRTTLNGRALGGVIASDTFFTAVLRTWLGEKTSDAGLRKGLLGA